jgi:type II secretory pathway component GspD/PulD (secretin)
MKFIALLSVFFCSHAFAAANSALDLDVSLKQNSGTTQKMRMVLREGEVGYLAKEGSFVEVVGKTDKDGNIALKMKIGTIDKNGKKVINSTPTIIAVENQESSITVGEVNSPENLKLSVIAKKKAL